MSYASKQDIEKQYDAGTVLGVAPHPTDVGEVDTEKVLEACRAASGDIDGYLGVRYAVPLDETPDTVRRMAVDIALYRMSTEGQVTEERRKRYEDAIAFLKRVADNKARIPGLSLVEAETPPEPQALSRVPGRVSGPGRAFTRTTMRGVR